MQAMQCSNAHDVARDNALGHGVCTGDWLVGLENRRSGREKVYFEKILQQEQDSLRISWGRGASVCIAIN